MFPVQLPHPQLIRNPQRNRNVEVVKEFLCNNSSIKTMLLLCLPGTKMCVLNTITWWKHYNCPPSHVQTSLNTAGYLVYPRGSCGPWNIWRIKVKGLALIHASQHIVINCFQIYGIYYLCMIYGK
jgi:hypothetical protein